MKKIKIINDLKQLRNIPIDSIIKLNTANKKDYIKVLKFNLFNKTCSNCYFYKNKSCIIRNTNICSNIIRKDNTSVIFKKLTKLELLKKMLWIL